MEAPSGKPSVYHIEGDAVKKKISKTNDYQQAGEKYRSLSRMDQEHLVANLVADLTPIDKQITQRVIANLTKADPELGKSVAKGLKL